MMKLRDLLNACKPPGRMSGKELLESLDMDVVVLHCGRASPVLDAKVMGHCTAVVQKGGRIQITEEMRAKVTFNLCIMVEGWNERHD